MNTSLKLIRIELTEVVSYFVWKSETTVAQRPGQVAQQVIIFTGLNNVRKAIIELERTGLFSSLLDGLMKSAIFTTGNDTMTIASVEGVDIVNKLELLKTLVVNFLTTLNNTLPNEEINSINIKLPQLHDFNELSEYSRSLHLALTQLLYTPEIQGVCLINSVENGSIWLNVYIGAPVAVSLIGSLAWASSVIFKKVQEGRLLQQQVESLKVKNESLQDIVNANKQQLDILIQAEAENLQSEYFKENPAEMVEKLKNSIKLLAGLIEKGAEINPALIAPENVKNLFPDNKAILGIESKIKKLAESNN